mgnify:CR=1 FL=1
MPVKKTPKNKKSGSPSKKKVSNTKPAVKKTKKKRVSPKKSTNKVNKKELKKAVDRLPGLIAEKAKLEKKEIAPEQITERPRDVIEIRELKPTGETKTRVGQNYDDGRDKKWLMWLGVIIFATAILALWGWNLIVKFQDTAKIDNLGIIKEVKEEIQTTLKVSETEEDEETNEAESVNPPPEGEDGESLKEKLKQNIASIITTIKTGTTTPNVEKEDAGFPTNASSTNTEIIEKLDNTIEKNNNEIITPSL